MKEIKFTLLFLFINLACFGQGKWTRKAGFSGSARSKAVGFSIGNKGYISTGSSGSSFYKDLWEYNPQTDAWMQKADFGGSAREGAVGFTTGNRGFVGLGRQQNTYYTDFWQYNPQTNAWVQKANFTGAGRIGATRFVTGGKAYVGLGFDGANYLKGVWEYDPANDSWSRKKDFPATNGRLYAHGFAVNGLGYVGSGSFLIGGIDFCFNNDNWQYNPATDSWVQRNTSLSGCISLSTVMNGKGYVYSGTSSPKIYEYNHTNDSWAGKADNTDNIGEEVAGFTYNNQLYVLKAGGTDLWLYNPNVLPDITNFAGTLVSVTKIGLSWKDNATEEEKYEIYRSLTPGSNFVKIAETGANATSYTDTGRSPDVTYYYKIKAVNVTKGIESDFSSEISINTSLVVNINLITIFETTSTAKLAWTTSNLAIGGYKLERSENDNSNYKEVATIAGNALNYTDQGLLPDKTYFYRLRAYQETGFSQYSNETSFNTTLVVTINLSSVFQTTTKLKLTWTTNNIAVDGYKLERSENNNGSYQEVATIAGNVLEYTDQGLVPDKTYFYRLRAYQGIGFSQYSNGTSASTLLSANIGLQALMHTTSSLKLVWVTNNTTIDGYKLERSEGDDLNYKVIVTISGSISEYIDRNLDASKTYFYRLRAYQGSGFSQYSNEITAKTSLIATITLQAHSYAASAINLTWETNNNLIDGYKIERTDNQNKGYSEIKDIPVNSASGYTDEGLESGKTYFYRIRAYQGSAYSAYSNRVGANTIITGINKVLAQKIRVANNPNTLGVFYLKIEGVNHHDWSIKLRDSQMKALKTAWIQSTTTGYKVDLTWQPAGIYYVIFETNKGQVVKKLLKL